MEGGAIAIVKNGDRIKIDIPRRRIDLLASAEEIEERLASWKAPKPKITKGYLSRYAKMVTSAGTGAIVK
jgi:dihydroxy-acid dehydratase